jgi:hypothetical protein
MPKKGDPIQIRSGRWYAAGHGPPLMEECCDCGLVHRQEFKFELKSGKILVWVRWIVDDKETRKARRRPQKFTRAS